MYENWDEEDYLEEEEYPTSRAAERRKNEWKFANRRKEILGNSISKPLHYYSKNMPESHAFDKVSQHDLFFEDSAYICCADDEYLYIALSEPITISSKQYSYAADHSLSVM